MVDQSSEIAREIALFADCGPLRTWSVIVTIMGDLLRAPGDCISGRSLAALVGGMGISEQALRVAVHRLKKDGWIESRREGRESLHFLSATARRETEAVRPLIYGGRPVPPEAVSLVVTAPDGHRSLPASALLLTPHCALIAAAPEDVDKDFLAIPLAAAALPEWVQAVLAPDTMRVECETLARQTRLALETLPEPPEQRLVLRLIILHHWRRLALRQSPLAETLLPGDWAGARARQVVHSALALLPPVATSDLKSM